MTSAALMNFLNSSTSSACTKDETRENMDATKEDREKHEEQNRPINRNVLSQDQLRVRHATLKDTADVEALYWQHTWIDHVYERRTSTSGAWEASYNLVVENTIDSGRIIGHVTYEVHPCLDEINPATWQDWFFTNLQVNTKQTPMVTLFQTMVSCIEEDIAPVIRAALSWMFRHITHLEQVVHITRKGRNQNPTFLWGTGMTAVSLSGDHLVYEIWREKVAPRLDARPARLQDHDDVLPMLLPDQNKSAGQLNDQYFLAGLIKNKSSNHYTAVVTKNEIAVGIIHVSKEIDYDKINEHFELDIYHGLLKPSEKDTITYNNKLKNTPYHRKSRLTNTEPIQLTQKHTTKQALQTRDGVNEINTEFASVVSELENDVMSSNASKERSSILHSHNSSSVIQLQDVDRRTVGYQHSASSAHEKPTSILQQIWLTDLFSGIIENRFEDKQSSCPQHNINSAQQTRRSVYCGEANAVVIRMFAIDHRHAHRSLDLLTEVFHRYDDIDYVVVTQKPGQADPNILSLFNRVPKRSTSTFPEDLYVFHRAAAEASITLEQAHITDLPAIRKMVKYMDHADNLLQCLRQKFISGNPDGIFNVVSHENIVGVIVMECQQDMDIIKAHYDIEEYIKIDTDQHASQFGRVEYYILNPIYHRFKQQVLSELMRVTGYKALLYRYDLERGQCGYLTTTSLWPVKRRRQIQYSDDGGENTPDERIRHAPTSAAFFITSNAWVNRNRKLVTSRLVVIGSGDVGMAAIERIVFSKDIHFTSLAVVDPYGLQGDRHACYLARSMVPSTGNCQLERLSTLCLRLNVNVITDTMTEIDREQRIVRLSGGGTLKYETLLLTCGLQFQLPLTLTNELSSDNVHNKLPDVQKPMNVFTINNEIDAQLAIERVIHGRDDSSHAIVVYGRCIEALSCFAAVVKLKATTDQVIFIMPPQQKNNTFLITGDRTVEEAVFKRIQSCSSDTKLYDGFSVDRWITDETQNVIQLEISNKESPPSVYSILCSMLFVFEYKRVHQQTFKAINDASLVFDGRLVIDKEFNTCDAHIMAAGTLTKYPRRYHANHLSHERFNSTEVGTHLGMLVVQKYGEQMECTHESFTRLITAQDRRKCINHEHLTPEFTQKLVTLAAMPDDWKLMHIRSANYQLANNSNTSVTTGSTSVSTDSGYMTIEISPTRTVDKIVCYSKNQIDTDNMMCLYGMHEVLLNNLVARYKSGMITDLYKFFREPWAAMVFHDRFDQLLSCARAITHQCTRKDLDNLEEAVMDTLNRYGEVSDASETELLVDFRRCGGVQKIETLVLHYLDAHKYHLPMYAREGTAQMLSKEVEEVVKSANEIILSSQRHKYYNYGLNEL